MASTSPYNPSVKKSNIAKKQQQLLLFTIPFLLLLLLFTILALFLLHINHLLLHSPSLRPPLLHYLLSPLSHHPLSSFTATQLLQHHLSFLLSPFPIFILANLIIFTLLFKTLYLSSSPPPTFPHSSTALSDFSDFASSGKFDYGDASLPEYAPVPTHEDFFFSSPPPHAHYIVSSDPSEEYHVLSFGAASKESTYFRTLQSFDKLNNEWKQVKGVSCCIDSKVLASKDQAKRQHKMVIPEKVHMPSACKMSSVEHGRLPESKSESLVEDGKLDVKTCRSLQETASNCSSLMAGGSQAVVINMEPAITANRRPRILTPPSHPPPPATSPARQATIKVPLSSTSTNMFMHRPPSSPKAKKSLQQITGSPDGRSNGANAKPLISENDKQGAAAKTQLRRSVQQHQSKMVRSYSDQRLSQQNSSRSSDVANAVLITGRSSAPAHVQKARSAIDNLLTTASLSANRPKMQRTQSLKGSGSPSAGMAPSSPAAAHHVTRSPSFSEALDALSDVDANKRFSNFISHRFALMKKELIN